MSRNFSIRIQRILDEWIPPRLRDSRWFMWLPMKLVLRDATHDFLTFKDTVFELSAPEFADLNRRTAHVQSLQGDTDLNQECIDEILATVSHTQLLEVGCGRGHLARLLAREHDVTACDIGDPPTQSGETPFTFLAGNVEELPFADASFDTVVCTHTLEHVQHLDRAIAELRRVTRKELIVVVPRQRPYKYTFSLHTQFFPYRWSLRATFGSRPGSYVKELGDWLYYEPGC